MAASSAPPKAPPHHCQGPSASPASPWVLWILLLTLVFLPSTSSNTCGEPPTFENMSPAGDMKSSYNVGERVEYECNPGYSHRPSLPKFITCQENQQWSQISNDTCYKKSCPRQAEPSNSRVNVVNGSYEYGSQIEYVCNVGYHLIGERILYCQLSNSDVQWSGSPPKCEKITCASPPQIPNAEYSGVGTDSFEYNAVVIYTCIPGSGPDEFSLIGESELYCIGPGKWSSDPPKCKVVKCPIPTVTNGRLVSGSATKYGYNKTVQLECNPGLYLHGSNLSTCGENSTWQPPIPSCLKEPPSPTKSPPNLRPSVSMPSGPAPSSARPLISRIFQYTSLFEGPFDLRDILGWIVALIITMLGLS
uniref:Membrane cofactor protein n=1 Tax=Oryctolagus cuniculus TaxID=9986 RepID=A0A5F9CYL8_RABIT